MYAAFILFQIIYITYTLTFSTSFFSISLLVLFTRTFGTKFVHTRYAFCTFSYYFYRTYVALLELFNLR